MLSNKLTLGTIALVLAAYPAVATAQTSGADAAYIAKVSTAAPAAVVKSATIVQMQNDGSMRTIQSGTNGFTCMMIDPTTPMCADKYAMSWMQALLTHGTPPEGVGFVYMLAGDDGASNTDPYAKGPTADNHWLKTGPHVMIVGTEAKSMGYPANADADATTPYVMWSQTPYAHIMIPVSVSP
ncbi:MAG TPA: hypothetical protein VMU38_05290 [Candidatus Binatia bacterium]|nr:hypothetical protein [Candidatus Binatia bacterium]